MFLCAIAWCEDNHATIEIFRVGREEAVRPGGLSSPLLLQQARINIGLQINALEEESAFGGVSSPGADSLSPGAYQQGGHPQRPRH